jgi:hypothetical protein
MRATWQPLHPQMGSRQHSEIILTFVGLEFFWGDALRSSSPLLAIGESNGARAILKVS